jgi:hypothetical protein
MIKLAIYEGKAWFGSLIHYLLHAGITCSLSADIEVFDKWWNGGNLTIDLNGIIDEALGYALPDNMQELVRQYMPDFQTLELEIPGLRALFGISASRWDFFFSKASTLTPMDFLNLIWQSEDLVKLEEWVPDAAGYLLEPGVLGSELLDDLAAIIPGFGLVFAVIEGVGDILGKVQYAIDKWNDYVSLYNYYRVTLMSALGSSSLELSRWLTGMIVENWDNLEDWAQSVGLDISNYEDVANFAATLASSIYEYSDKILEFLSAHLPVLGEIPITLDFIREFSWAQELGIVSELIALDPREFYDASMEYFEELLSGRVGTSISARLTTLNLAVALRTFQNASVFTLNRRLLDPEYLDDLRSGLDDVTDAIDEYFKDELWDAYRRELRDETEGEAPGPWVPNRRLIDEDSDTGEVDEGPEADRRTL